MPSSQWKKGFRISPRCHSHGRPYSKPWSKRATLILKVQETRDLIRESSHFMTMETGTTCLIVECSEHRFRVQPIVVLSGLKGKLCEEEIAWQPAYVLQLPNQELATMPYQLGQGKIRTNIYKNTLVRLLQCLPLQQSLRRSQNHLRIQGHQIQEKGKPCQPSRDTLLQFLHCLQSQGQLHHQFRRELPLSLPSEVSILIFYQSLTQESLGIRLKIS